MSRHPATAILLLCAIAPGATASGLQEQCDSCDDELANSAVQLKKRQAAAAALESGSVTLPYGAVVDESDGLGAAGGNFGPSADAEAVAGLKFYRSIRYAYAERHAPPEVWDSPENAVFGASTPIICAGQEYWVEDPTATVAEDCHFLDVIKPDIPGPAPVMMWVHGGGLLVGSKDDAYSDWKRLAFEGGVVVVPINYRVNFFGFFAHPEVPQALGIQDCIAALTWIRDNIGAFGGDPGTVTIFGQSGGGTAINLLYQSPLAKGLFHRAIAQSPYRTQIARDVPFFKGETCMASVSCDSAECLLDKSLEELQPCLDLYSFCCGEVWEIPAPVGGSTLDGPTLGNVCEGRQVGSYDVPLMIGSNYAESRLFFAGASAPGEEEIEDFFGLTLPGYSDADRATQLAVRQVLLDLFGDVPQGGCMYCPYFDPQLQALSTQLEYILGPQMYASVGGAPKYRYLMDFEAGGGYFGTCHVLELEYLAFEDPSSFGMLAGSSMAEEKKFSAKMLRQYWASFARTGVPTSSMGPDFEPTNPAEHPRFGLPMMRFGLGEGASAMSTEPFYNEETAQLTADMICGSVTLDSLSLLSLRNATAAPASPPAGGASSHKDAKTGKARPGLPGALLRRLDQLMKKRQLSALMRSRRPPSGRSPTM